MSPESILDRTYSKETDIWMFGVLLFEILTQTEPYSGKDIDFHLLLKRIQIDWLILIINMYRFGSPPNSQQNSNEQIIISIIPTRYRVLSSSIGSNHEVRT